MCVKPPHVLVRKTTSNTDRDLQGVMNAAVTRETETDKSHSLSVPLQGKREAVLVPDLQSDVSSAVQEITEMTELLEIGARVAQFAAGAGIVEEATVEIAATNVGATVLVLARAVDVREVPVAAHHA